MKLILSTGKVSKAIGLAISLQSTCLAVVISNQTQQTNDRFSNDPSFIANSYDLSGVGRTGGNVNQSNWATRIGDNYFLTANHFKPNVGENVTFYSSNDPTGPSFTYATAGGFQIGGTDIWLGYFNQSIDSSIKTYSYSTTAANSLIGTGIANQNVLMLGTNKLTGDGYGGGRTTNISVAQNQAESWFEQGTNSVDAAGVTNTFTSSANWDQLVTFQNLNGDTANSFQTYEGQLEAGDSGSPLMIDDGGELVIVGLAWSIFTQNGGLEGNFVDDFGPSPFPDPYENRNASFYTYVGSYADGIQTAIGNVPAPIPEPSSAIMLIVGLTGLTLRRIR